MHQMEDDISVNIHNGCVTGVHTVLLAESINSCIQILGKVEKFLRYIDNCVKRDLSSLCENGEIKQLERLGF